MTDANPNGDSLVDMLVDSVDTLSFGAFGVGDSESRETAGDISLQRIGQEDHRATADGKGDRRVATYNHHYLGVYRDPIDVQGKNMSCASTVENAKRTLPTKQGSTLYEVMECIAFPEEHITCPPVYEMSGNEAHGIPFVLPSPGIGGLFEAVMDCLAFPEKAVIYSEPIDDKGPTNSGNHVLDDAAFPERRMPLPAVVQYRKGSKTSSFLSDHDKAKHQYLVSKNRDILGDASKDVGGKCCVSPTGVVSRALNSKGDLLDSICSNVEDVLCRDGTYLIDDLRADTETDTYIERSNSVIYRNASHMPGDVLVVRDQSARQQLLSPGTSRKTLSLLSAENDRDTSNCNVYECNPSSNGSECGVQHTACSLDRNTSWVSESSSVSSLSSFSRATMKHGRGAADYGMELVLVPQNGKTKKKTIIERYFAAKGAKKAANKPRLSKQSRRFLAEDDDP